MVACPEEKNFSSKLRQTLRASGMPVYLLTCNRADGRPAGIAVTAANMLSMEPPSMLVVIKHSSSCFEALVATERFCISLISSADLELLDVFSRSDLSDERFSVGEWDIGWNGIVYLKSAVSSVFCKVEGAYDYGQNRVFFGRINDIRTKTGINDAPDPLIWLNGRPGRVVYATSGDL